MLPYTQGFSSLEPPQAVASSQPDWLRVPFPASVRSWAFICPQGGRCDQMALPSSELKSWWHHAQLQASNPFATYCLELAKLEQGIEIVLPSIQA